MAAVTDYDTRRAKDADPETESIELLQETRSKAPSDMDTDPDEVLELSSFEVVEEDLTALVIPVQNDEFRCTSCFLVLHRSLQAAPGSSHCRDC